MGDGNFAEAVTGYSWGADSGRFLGRSSRPGLWYIPRDCLTIEVKRARKAADQKRRTLYSKNPVAHRLAEQVSKRMGVTLSDAIAALEESLRKTSRQRRTWPTIDCSGPPGGPRTAIISRLTAVEMHSVFAGRVRRESLDAVAAADNVVCQVGAAERLPVTNPESPS